MKIILLGSRGQLGSDIMTAAACRGGVFKIIPLDRDVVDVSNAEAAAEAIAKMAADAVINCTSYHKTDEVEGNAQLAFAINAFFPRALAKRCVLAGRTLVHVSTDYVFGGQAKRAPLVEEDARAPLNVYGASKAMGEDLILRQGGHALILRVASLFGVAGASGKGGNFVETMLRVGKEHGKVRVVADQIMSPTATADIAEATLDLLVCQASAGVYHVVNRGEVSWAEFAEGIFAAAGYAVDVEAIASTEFPMVAERPPYSVLSPAKLEATIGRPMATWQDALGRYMTTKHPR